MTRSGAREEYGQDMGDCADSFLSSPWVRSGYGAGAGTGAFGGVTLTLTSRGVLGCVLLLSGVCQERITLCRFLGIAFVSGIHGMNEIEDRGWYCMVGTGWCVGGQDGDEVRKRRGLGFWFG